MELDKLLNTILRGVQTGSLYALVAIGLNIAFRATKVFNFAHGDFVMVGTVAGVLLWQEWGLPLIPALLVASLGAALMAVIVERVAVRPTIKQPNPQWIVSTLGASVVISTLFNELLLNTGDKLETRVFPDIVHFDTFQWRTVYFIPTRMLPVAVLILMATALTLLFAKTDFGRAFNAVADDRDAAALRGVPVMAISILAFALAGLTAGIAGFIAGPITQASAFSGLPLTISAFVASAIGGMGTIRGAVVGGIVLGVIEASAAQYLDTRFSAPIVLVAFLVVLMIRPQGLTTRSFRTV